MIRYWITQLYPDTFPWDRIRVERSHPASIWVRPLLMQGKPKGLKGLWMSKGQVTPPGDPRLRLVHPAPRLTRILLRQDPTSHLSKSEVTRLADRGAALGHGTQTANLPRGVRFPNDSLWGRVRMGEIQRSPSVQCCS